MKNDRSRSIVLGLAACGLLTWWPAAQAHGLGGAVGAGVSGGARAGGSLVGGPSMGMVHNVRVDTRGSIGADSGPLRSKVDQGQRDVTEDAQATRNRATATAQQAAEIGQSTAAAARETSGRAVAAAATEADGRADAAVHAAGTGVAGSMGRADTTAEVGTPGQAHGAKSSTPAVTQSAHEDGTGAEARNARRETPKRGAGADVSAEASMTTSGDAQGDTTH